MNMNSDTLIFTVTQINEYVKMLLETSEILSHVSLRGEISNFTNHSRSGHLYFSLKDEGGLIRAVMFRSAAASLRFKPENGMTVCVHGRVSAYVRDGQYQFYVESMEPDGLGALSMAFEQCKRRLEAEGLFDPSRKKPIPHMPQTIGVITAPTGAAVRDMINILKRRFPLTKMILFPTLVQGENAARQLTSGVQYFNRTNEADVIIIGRGGGSMEDLFAFNDETLARAIAASHIPVISGVGHETDFTICDFVADLRAPTPSAAMELAVPDMQELHKRMQNQYTHIHALMMQRITASRNTVDRLQQARVLTAPTYYTDARRMELLQQERALCNGFEKHIAQHKSRMQLLSARLVHGIEGTQITGRRQFSDLAAKLSALDPMAVIGRGYSAVYDASGECITGIQQLQTGQKITLRTFGGCADGVITDVKPDAETEK